MGHAPFAIAALLGFGLAADAVDAATESYIFDATLTSGNLLCGEAVGSEVFCPPLFGVIDEATIYDDLMVGLSIGGTYSGRLDLIYDDLGTGTPSLSGASCSLNGVNCFFDDEFLPLGASPLGPAPGALSLGDLSTVESLFTISGDTGTYSYSTDFLFRDSDGSVYYYTDVSFDLANVNFSPVPLPAGVFGLLTGLGALGVARARRRQPSAQGEVRKT